MNQQPKRRINNMHPRTKMSRILKSVSSKRKIKAGPPLTTTASASTTLNWPPPEEEMTMTWTTMAILETDGVVCNLDFVIIAGKRFQIRSTWNSTLSTCISSHRVSHVPYVTRWSKTSGTWGNTWLQHMEHRSRESPTSQPRMVWSHPDLLKTWSWIMIRRIIKLLRLQLTRRNL